MSGLCPHFPPKPTAALELFTMDHRSTICGLAFIDGLTQTVKNRTGDPLSFKCPYFIPLRKLKEPFYKEKKLLGDPHRAMPIMEVEQRSQWV